MAMESETVVLLAREILSDFGASVQRVGRVLLEHGTLSVQDLLRVSARTCSVDEEPLTFLEVRNALQLLLQHGVATSRPHHFVANDESMSSVMHTYSLDARDVLGRLRFPHYLEHVLHHYHLQCNDELKGHMANQLLLIVLFDGRVSEEAATAKALAALRRRYPQVDVDLESMKAMFRRLVGDCLLRSYMPLCHSTAELPAQESCAKEGAAAPAGAPATSSTTPAPAPLTDAPPPVDGQLVAAPEAQASADAAGKRKLADNGDDGPSRKVARTEAEDAPFFGFNRRNLDLRLCKDIIVRVVEDRQPLFVAQVFRCALDGIKLSPSEDTHHLQVSTEWMRFPQLEAKTKEMGFVPAGGDPKRQRDQLQKALTILSVSQDQLLKMRHAPLIHEGAASRATTRKRGSAAARAAAAKAAAEAAPLADGSEADTKEWAVEWENVRRALVKAVTSRYMKDQFGVNGHRIYNLLTDRSPPQKLEEQQIMSTCMISVEEGREVLNKMARRGVVKWQEVPKSATAPLAASFWLYYVDPYSVWVLMLKNFLQAVLNLRICGRKWSARLAPLEEADALSRTAARLAARHGAGAGSATTTGLGPQEKKMLHDGRRVEDALERSCLSLEVALLVLTCFSQLAEGSS